MAGNPDKVLKCIGVQKQTDYYLKISSDRVKKIAALTAQIKKLEGEIKFAREKEKKFKKFTLQLKTFLSKDSGLRKLGRNRAQAASSVAQLIADNIQGANSGLMKETAADIERCLLIAKFRDSDFED